MNTRETLILQALKRKEIYSGSGNGAIIDTILAQNPDQADNITKNVCARIPLDLANEMDQLSALIDLNKREMITLAIVDFLQKARDTLDEFDAWPSESAAQGTWQIEAIEPAEGKA